MAKNTHDIMAQKLENHVAKWVLGESKAYSGQT